MSNDRNAGVTGEELGWVQADLGEARRERDKARAEVARIRAAAAAYIQALDDRKAIKSDVRDIDLFREARYRVRDTLADLRAALAATEGKA